METAEQKEKKEDPIVIDKDFNIKVKEAIDKLFLIGWHDSHGTFEHEGETWKVEIAGGCRALVVTRPDNRKFHVDLSELVGEMLEDIKGVK